jgi:hypothetical protein
VAVHIARIRITGFRNAKTIDEIFASSLVDVAYVDEVLPDAIYAISDVGVDLERPEDFAWVKGVIESTLARHGEGPVAITLAREGE